MTLKELEKRGIKGELLTTNYQRFTSPDALRKLHSLSNLTIRMFLKLQDVLAKIK